MKDLNMKDLNMKDLNMKDLKIKCCLCNEDISVDDLTDHTIWHIRDEIEKREILLELRK